MNRISFGLIMLLALLFVHKLFAAQPELLLLSKYRSDMDVKGWYMSEKLDGVRAYWNGHTLLSRQGNRFSAPAWFTKEFPPFELDGELWIGRGRFEEVAAIVSRHQPHSGWKDLSYQIFEVPNAPGGLDARLQQLRDYLASHPVEHIQILTQTPCLDRSHLQIRLEEVEAMGGEGLVLRNPDTPYETGRSINALKVKSYEDMEGEVIGYRPGKGKYTGMVGALEVHIGEGRKFFIGSGLSDQLRLQPPPLGSLISFKFYGFTNSGIPRFASFLRIRDDVNSVKE